MPSARTYPRYCSPAVSLCLVVFVAAIGNPVSDVIADIMGGTGNVLLKDHGWQTGAAAAFNVQSRVAYWEGPPFGGGQWHAECRGNIGDFNKLLQAFAKIDSKEKRLVVHDGVGQSFWLNPNGKEEKRADARIDWMLTVWVIESWQTQQKFQAEFRSPDVTLTGDPVPQVDVYTGLNIDWAKVVIPEGITVDDQRLEAHGFTIADGKVIEGHVTDLATDTPLAAEMVLQRIEPQKKGGYQYTDVATSHAELTGRWTMTSTPAGWYQVVVRADGYVPRIAGYIKTDSQPNWAHYDTGLARTSKISGTVKDTEGNPMDGVTVQLHSVVDSNQESYKSTNGYRYTTDADGRFEATGVPAGAARVVVRKKGYCRPGLGTQIEIPATDIELEMQQSSRVVVTVNFDGVVRPADYIVSIEPAEGRTIGSWGGSGSIDTSDARTFENVPPGRYILKGRPNPGNPQQETAAVTVDLIGGETSEVVLKAKE